MRVWIWAALLVILMFGAGMRFHQGAQSIRFHPDEALFSTFARDAAVHGDWMLSGALDKPPLSLYASALSMHLIGVYVNDAGVLDIDRQTGEFAARLPNIYAGVILIAATYALAVAVTGDRWAGLGAAGLVAFSPQLVAYSATAFTDLLMLTAGVVGLALAARGRAVGAGVCLALAFWSKQQGVFYLPLALWLLPAFTLATVAQVGVTFGAGVALLLGWDAARQQSSLFALASVNNRPDQLIVPTHQVMERLRVWWWHLNDAWGVQGRITSTLIVLAAIRNITDRPKPVLRQHWRMYGLCAYIVGYVLLHSVVAFNLYDRYLLLIVPLLAVWIASQIPFVVIAVTCGLIFAVVTPQYVSDSRARDDEILQLADWLNDKPLGTIIYDHWLGWEMGYYIGAWSDKRRVYYPEPAILAQDARLNPDPAPRYFIAPQVPHDAWLDALRKQGFTVSLAYETARYLAYEVVPP